MSSRRARRRIPHVQKWVIGLSIVVFVLALSNWVRMGMALWYSVRVPDLLMTVSWSHLAVMGGVWGTVFLVCGVGLYHFRPWGRWTTLVAVTAYEAHVWFNHLLFDASDYAHLTRFRDLLLTLLLLAPVWGLLSLPIVRRTFSGGVTIVKGRRDESSRGSF